MELFALRARRLLAATSLLILAVGSAACQVEDAEGGGSGGDATGSKWIIGSWTGTYRDKSPKQDSTLQVAKAKAVFESSDDFQGRFRIELPEIENAFVEGTFVDFARKNLLLDITGSTVSSLGLQGARMDVDYALAGNTLELADDRIVIRLLRDKDDNANGGAGSETPSQHPLVGRYSCRDSQKRSWQIIVKSETAFSAYIDGGNPYMDGSVRIEPKDAAYSAILTIDTSNDDGAKGLELRLKRGDKSEASVTRTIREGERLAEVETLACTYAK